MEYWWAYCIIGLVCGIFSSVFGVGSGILLIPALVVLFHTAQKSAQGICLAVMVPMACVGAVRYYMNPEIEINLKIVLWLSIGAVLGALIGSTIAGWASGLVLRRLFAVIMIVVAIKMLVTSPAKKPSAGPPGATSVIEATASLAEAEEPSAAKKE